MVRGIDDITHACQRQIERFVSTHDGDRATTTVVSYCASGLREFLDYLLIVRASKGRTLTLDDIDRDLIDGFLASLDGRKLAISTKRTIYTQTKPVLLALGQRGLFRLVETGDQATFPRDPFPLVNLLPKGETPLPKAQRRAFTAAIKTAVMPLFDEGTDVHRQAVFLGKTQRDDNRVRTLSVVSWNAALKAFAAQHGIAWKLRSHQFRRTFANYAARSQFGDLRYLKEHFKHWSMDMTLCYALNESQEMALFTEIADELDELKEGVVSQWLDPDEPLAGGYGRGIVDWRGSNAITIFKDRSSMVRSIAESTAIRSNGHAWCTADDNLCVGNGGLEASRCTGCENAVIGRRHVGIYQGLHDHLKELLDCKDIGEGGLARVRRDLERCRDVLTLLGHAPSVCAA